MLRDIIRKEIIDHISSMKFVVTFVVVMVLIISGLIIGTKDYLEKKKDSEYQVQLNQKMMESQADWLTAGYIGIFEAKKPYILSTIDHGIDNSLGRQAQISMGLDTHMDQSRNLLAPILAVFGEVDLTFVVKIILSLFVILLTFDAISGEKERGTLKLTLANSVKRHTFILGKMIGGFIIILVAFLLPLLLGMAFMMGFYPQVLADFDLEAWLRLLIIVGIYILYLATFFSVGVFVSALCHKSSTSFIVLLMVWVLFVAIIPGMSLSVSERIRPYEPYVDLQTKGVMEIAADRKETMKDFNNQAIGKAFQEGKLAELFADLFKKQTELQQNIMAKYDKEFERQQNSQIQLAESIARTISPTSALSFAVQNLSGSGYLRQKDYTEQLREFQKDFRNKIISKIANAELKTQEQIQEFFSQEKLDVSQQDVKFTFREESLGEVTGRSMIDIAVLAILSILFFAAAYLAFIRYDVR